MIKRTDEEKNTQLFYSLQEAATSVDSKLENWKVQLYIADAINNNKRAFKFKWEKVK